MICNYYVVDIKGDCKYKCGNITEVFYSLFLYKLKDCINLNNISGLAESIIAGGKEAI
jgi:hypothetical protein